MEEQSFDRDFYLATLRTCHEVGFMEQWKPDSAARLMAILQVWGNNEGFTLSQKFQCDREYIQDIYHLRGGEVPDPSFARQLRSWVCIYERVKSPDDTAFIGARDWIQQMYGFKLYC